MERAVEKTPRPRMLEYAPGAAECDPFADNGTGAGAAPPKAAPGTRSGVRGVAPGALDSLPGLSVPL